MAAGELGKNFNITLPSLSHHLNVLKQADLVASRRKGQEIIYSLNLSVFEEMAEKLIKFLILLNNFIFLNYFIRQIKTLCLIQ